MPRSLHRILPALGAMLALGAFGLAGYLARGAHAPPPDVVIEPDPDCNLHQAACRARLPDGGELSLSVTPRPIAPAQPLRLEVSFTGTSASAVKAVIISLDMYMGRHARALQPLDAGRFAADAILPVCTRERMRWQLTVVARGRREVVQVPFHFEA